MSHPLRGIALVCAALACFAALDTSTKLINAVVPLAMAIWIRYLFQVVVTVAVLQPRRGRALWRTRHPVLQFWRGLLLVSASAIAFLSLRHMAVGEFTAIVLLTPLVLTLLAAHTLGERVSPLRWMLVVGGFAGALIVIRPHREDFNWALLLPLTLVACNAAFQLITIRLAKVDDAATTHVYTGCIGTALATLALPFAWQSLPSASLWGVLLLMCIFSSAGHLLLIKAYAHAPASTLTPFLYLQIVFASIAGWLVFAHVPDGWSLLGIAVIGVCGATGTWLTARERRPQASDSVPPALET